MTREDIIRMAREVSNTPIDHHATPELFGVSQIERFAALVAAAEREACKALHQHEDVLAPVGNSAWGEAYQEGWAAGTAAYRDAILARSNT